MATLYKISGWSDHFENNRTRDLKRMTFACIPNKQDGDGYTELLDHDDGPAHYGAWIALVLVASKGDKESRGILIRDNGTPHDPKSLQRMTRIPVRVWNEVLPRLVLIGWLTVEVLGPECDTATPHDPAPDCGFSAPTCGEAPEHSAGTCVPHACAERNGMEGNGTEGNGKNGTEMPAAPQPSSSKASPVDRSEEIRRVFEHYKARFPKRFPRVHSDLKEWGLIRDRLKDGYGTDDLCDAIDGMMRSPFHQGDNPQQKPYDALEIVVRDAKHVDDFRAVPARAGPVLSDKTRKSIQARDNVLDRFFPEGEPHDDDQQAAAR